MDVLLAERYQTTDLLGVGGAASVYRAVDRNLQRDVAVKVFNPTTADDDDYRRQHTETLLLSTLNHPGLVTLHDAGLHQDEDGRTTGFLVMELVDGEDLRKLLKKGPLAPAAVAQVGADLADALAYIHSHGVVHRDVKPANILMFHSGENDTRLYPKLTDFGIARMVNATMATATGATIGTANYLSPEQAQSGDVDERSDIYSLGLVLLECLTGDKAFPGPIVEAALARLLRDPEIPEWLGADWAGLLTRMTARNPQDRPDAHEVALLLRAHSDEGAGFWGIGTPQAAADPAPADDGDGVSTGGITTGNIHIPDPPSHAPSLG
ncbi:serine/threonine protein kinase [Arthrobacter crusticola]|uniref:non-specific serine/threonine protein kinase n=1 Tax=Arthrobacter crusticola TaxID=2547960 RepID=A0A4V3AMQ5_9MICC|nr:serine/threonine-protein kinase [Arthrobacter crusticola]TDK27644.1 serine/threonine protein kinase [Arthrobacter crusticola]